jgi:hypothetical protein
MAVRNDDDVSTLQLISELLRDVRTLMRQETALARAEIRTPLPFGRVGISRRGAEPRSSS